MKQIPNTLTVIRLLLAFFFPVAPSSWHMAIIVFALATEFLDGFLARMFHWASKTGQALDPIADKLFFLSVCLTWIWIGKLSWVTLALLGTREIGIAAILLFLVFSGRMKRTKLLRPRPLSKVTTVFQYFSFFLIAWWKESVLFLVLLTAVTGFLAAVQYMVLLRHQQRSRD